MQKEVISSSKAPAVRGAPFSPAVKAGQFVFVSGQIADDVGADVKVQTRQVLEKIKSLVEAAGSSMANVVKCTVYLTNLGDFASMNEVYREFFTDKLPARACVEVSGLVRGCKVEIEAIAFV